jgi:hypothetical protein
MEGHEKISPKNTARHPTASLSRHAIRQQKAPPGIRVKDETFEPQPMVVAHRARYLLVHSSSDAPALPSTEIPFGYKGEILVKLRPEQTPRARGRPSQSIAASQSHRAR